MRAREVFDQSLGHVTSKYYADLQTLGIAGTVAVNLFRACKCSHRAKLYRGEHKGSAYERKQWSIDNLVTVLDQHAAALGIVFGWKVDPAKTAHYWVLYIDLPTGQVSFHSPTRGIGPDYQGDWDRHHLSDWRICAWCDHLMKLSPMPINQMIVAEKAKQPLGGNANMRRTRERRIRALEQLAERQVKLL